MAIASIVLNEMGLGLGWVYNFMAIALGSAVVPIACAIYTPKLDAMFAILSAVFGAIAAVIVWLSVASTYGPIDLVTTGKLYAQLAGGCTALGASFIICCIGCLVKPMNYDWNNMIEGIKLVGGDGGENSEGLLAAKAWIFKYGWGYSVILCVAWPLACIPFGAFGKSTFQLWAAVALMWGWIAGLTVVALPIYESFDDIMSMLGFKKKATGKGTPTEQAYVDEEAKAAIKDEARVEEI